MLRCDHTVTSVERRRKSGRGRPRRRLQANLQFFHLTEPCLVRQLCRRYQLEAKEAIKQLCEGGQNFAGLGLIRMRAAMGKEVAEIGLKILHCAASRIELLRSQHWF